MSFSISASPMQLASADIIALLTEQQVCWVKSDTAGLCLQFLQPSSLLSNAKSTSFTPPRLNGSSIRLFGKPVNWLLLNTLSQLLSDGSWLKLSLLAPHPQLPLALLIQLTDVLSTEQQRQLDGVTAEQHIEMVYLAAKSVQFNKPGLLVMDMDSTAISIECIDEIATLAGVGTQVAAITARAMNGELDFAASLQERVAALKGTPQSVLQHVAANLPLMPGLTELVSSLQQRQWRVAIASGGFTFFTTILQQQLSLSATFANVLEITNGLLTGKLVGDMVDANVKARVVTELAARFAIAPEQTVAIGDGANDIPMLKTAALGVAFHAKPSVQAAVAARINQGSLLQLLYLLDPV